MQKTQTTIEVIIPEGYEVISFGKIDYNETYCDGVSDDVMVNEFGRRAIGFKIKKSKFVASEIKFGQKFKVVSTGNIYTRIATRFNTDVVYCIDEIGQLDFCDYFVHVTPVE